LQDGINKDCGEFTKNQCIDTDCFRKVHKAFRGSQKTVKKATEKTVKEPTNSAKGSSNTTTKAASKPKAVEQKTPKVVIEGNLKLLREVSAELYADNAHLNEALHVAIFEKQLGKGGASKKEIHELYALSESALLERKQKNYLAYLETHSPELTEQNQVIDILISFLPLHKDAKTKVIEKWTPSDDILTRYTKTGLASIAKLSGFINDYEDLNGKGSFHKVENSSKPVLIKALLKSLFDWSAFAPKDLFLLVQKKAIKKPNPDTTKKV